MLMKKLVLDDYERESQRLTSTPLAVHKSMSFSFWFHIDWCCHFPYQQWWCVHRHLTALRSVILWLAMKCHRENCDECQQRFHVRCRRVLMLQLALARRVSVLQQVVSLALPAWFSPILLPFPILLPSLTLPPTIQFLLSLPPGLPASG